MPRFVPIPTQLSTVRCGASRACATDPQPTRTRATESSTVFERASDRIHDPAGCGRVSAVATVCSRDPICSRCRSAHELGSHLTIGCIIASEGRARPRNPARRMDGANYRGGQEGSRAPITRESQLPLSHGVRRADPIASGGGYEVALVGCAVVQVKLVRNRQAMGRLLVSSLSAMPISSITPWRTFSTPELGPLGARYQ